MSFEERDLVSCAHVISPKAINHERLKAGYGIAVFRYQIVFLYSS